MIADYCKQVIEPAFAIAKILAMKCKMEKRLAKLESDRSDVGENA